MRSLLRSFINHLIERRNRILWHKQSYIQVNERPIEYAFVLDCLAEQQPQTILDIGPGKTAWPALLQNCGFVITAVDKGEGYWKRPLFNPHWHILVDDITTIQLEQQFDFISCISVLEHIPDHAQAVQSMFRLLRPGGCLALTFPYNERRYVANAYDLPAASYGQEFGFLCQVFSGREVALWLGANQANLIRQEYYEIFEGDLWACGGRLKRRRKATKDSKHHLSCLLLQRS